MHLFTWVPQGVREPTFNSWDVSKQAQPSVTVPTLTLNRQEFPECRCWEN